MKTVRNTLPVLFASLLLISALCVSVFAANGFTYKHDPTQNPYAMKDIVVDENAVYGFRPSETGSLKMYADADWSDPEVVEKGRQDRIAYHQSIEAMYVILEEMTAEGRSVEEIARAVSAKRNEIRLAAYDDDPEGLEELKKRNLEKYGHEEGPLPDELYGQYGSWEAVMQKAFSLNAGMDACLGLYDDYYDVYVALGQAEEPREDADDPEEVGITDDTEPTGMTESGEADGADSSETDGVAPGGESAGIVESGESAGTGENSDAAGQTGTKKSPQTSDDSGVIFVVFSISVACLVSAIAFVVRRGEREE